MSRVLTSSGLKVTSKEDLISSDIFYMFDLDGSGKFSDWTVSGATALSINTSTPLRGSSSLEYRQVTASAVGDKIALTTISFPLQALDVNALKLSFRYRLYNAEDGDFYLNILSDTGVLRYSYPLTNDASKFKTIFSGNGDTGLNIEIEVKGLSQDAYIIFDGIELTDEPYGYGSIIISEAIEVTGFTSLSASNLILFKDTLSNDGDKLLALNITDHTRFTFKGNGKYQANASIESNGSAYHLIQHFNKDNVKIKQSYFDTTGTDNGQPSSLVGTFSDGDYLVVFSGGNANDSITTNFSVTATAQSDKIMFEDERKQAHVVASLKLEGNDGREITGGTEDIYFIGTGDGWVSNGDSNYYTVQKDNQLLTFQGQVYTTDASNGKYIDMYVNGVRYKRISDTIYTSNIDFSYTGNIGEFSKGDTISLRFGTTFTLNNQDWVHYLILREEYLPPLDQSSAPTILAVNASEENTYKFKILSDMTIAKATDSNVISSITKDGTGLYRIHYNTNIITSEPFVDPTLIGVQDYVAIHIKESTDTYCVVKLQRKDNGANVDGDFFLTIEKSGADRSPAKAYCVDGKTVVKEMVCEMYGASNAINSTSYVAFDLSSLSIEGDSFITKDQSSGGITLPDGKYQLTVRGSCYNKSGDFYCKFDDTLGNSVLAEKWLERSIANDGHNTSSSRTWIFTLDYTKTIVAYGKNEYTDNTHVVIREVIIRKLL